MVNEHIFITWESFSKEQFNELKLLCTKAVFFKILQFQKLQKCSGAYTVNEPYIFDKFTLHSNQLGFKITLRIQRSHFSNPNRNCHTITEACCVLNRNSPIDQQGCP